MSAAEEIGDQVACYNLGKAGCYFLAILHAFGGTDGALGWYYSAIDQKMLQPDGLVLDAGKLASALSGTKWVCHKEPIEYKAKPGEIEILRYQVDRTGGSSTHFVNGDGLGGLAHDPWPGSLTVKDGYLAGKRIFTRG